MKLRGEGAQFLQNGYANRFQVRLRFADAVVVLGVAGMHALEIAIEPDRIGISGHTPFRSTKQHGDVGRIGFHYARRNSAGFDGFVDRGENNVAVARYMNDYAAAGKVGDDFVFRRLILRSNGRMPAQRDHAENYPTEYRKQWRFAAEAHFNSMVRPVHFRRNPNYQTLELSLIGRLPIFCSFSLVAALSRIDVRK